MEDLNLEKRSTNISRTPSRVESVLSLVKRYSAPYVRYVGLTPWKRDSDDKQALSSREHLHWPSSGATGPFCQISQNANSQYPT